MTLSAGSWIRHYRFSSLAVLNSQLQTVLSLRRYALISEDTSAAAVTYRLKRTSARMLWRFDTGSWSLYALGGAPASRHYHMYVVDLLDDLVVAYPSNSVFARYATRFRRYADARTAPATRSGGTGPYVDPAIDALITWAN